MAQEIGADAFGFGLQMHPGIKGKSFPLVGAILAMSWEPNLWVNKYGKRFMDETIVHNFAMAGNAIEAQRDSYIWSIFDDNEINYVETEGTRTGVGVLMPVRTRLTGKFSLRKELKSAVDAGSKKVVKASSVSELAKKIGVPVANLSKAIESYNKIAEDNKDPEFVRDPATVHPIKAKTLYAIKVQPYTFASLGGLRTTTALEVVDTKDEPIKGLYVAGSGIGGIYGSTYTLWCSGSTYQVAATTGRLAGKSAAANAK
jgi:fumarate reductase flavoprotein subunit